MTFHFYLNLAFHANVSTIRILIVIYFNFFLVPALVPHIQPEQYQKEASQPIFLTLTFFDDYFFRNLSYFLYDIYMINKYLWNKL